MKINTKLCTGCRICEMICAIKHSEKINTERSRIRIESIWPEEEKIYVCHFCKKPKCVESCAEGALSQTEEGIIQIDEEKCTICQACIKACPFNAIFIDIEDKLLICDTCNGDYECVKWCPNDVLTKGGAKNG